MHSAKALSGVLNDTKTAPINAIIVSSPERQLLCAFLVEVHVREDSRLQRVAIEPREEESKSIVDDSDETIRSVDRLKEKCYHNTIAPVHLSTFVTTKDNDESTQVSTSQHNDTMTGLVRSLG